ncbi:uncharacterized protein LOC116849000 [Odontomachus brunneus]|uniref:uncharacterized protein LOC116849000 n=1 Tax=Odontomachus brunneus TaxID=486640 RepID=UPI0013F1DC7A|nr:uncharacterized protein LOC116849000 [Odontomachus brunneus]
MFRSIVVSLAVLALLQAAFAVIDVSKTKNIEIRFTDEDVVPKTALKTLAPETYADRYIGDLEVGTRFAEEMILRRVVVFRNPTYSVQRSSMTLYTNGIVHYLRVENNAGSYAVICDHSNTLGSRNTFITLRVYPQSNSTLSLILASH